MADSFDLARGDWVLFGGVIPVGVSPQQTWEFDGSVWRDATSLPAPDWGVMEYDAARGRHVLFEGARLNGAAPRTWEWDGQNWQDVTPAVSPSPRVGFAMAFDPVMGGVLLYGGALASGPPVTSDTWRWNGSSWTQLNPATVPTDLVYHDMVTDWRRHRIVMFSGHRVTTAISRATWVWDGQDWSRATNANDPPTRASACSTYDWLRDRVVMFGGYDPGTSRCLNETWEFDGSHWQQVQTRTAPTPRRGMAMTYDPTRRRVLGFGGECFAAPGRVFDNELWQFATPTPATYAVLGPGCSGTSGASKLSAPLGSLPWIDDTFDVDLLQAPAGASAFMATGFSASSWAGRPLPLDLGPFGAPGCPLRVAPFVWFPFSAGPAGTQRWRLPIPNDPRLAGLSFYNQALVLDPAANPLGVVLSDAQQGRVGIR
jgi:hypothetical protein